MATHALGATLRTQLEEILHWAQVLPAPSGEPIRLHTANVRHDIAVEWWHPTIRSLAEAIVGFNELDFSSSADIGRRLRPLAEAFVAAAAIAKEFIVFLDEFDQASAPPQLAKQLRATLAFTSHQFLDAVDPRPDDDAGRVADLAAGDGWAEAMVAAGDVLEEMTAEVVAVSQQDVLLEAFGRLPNEQLRHHAGVGFAFGGSPADRLALAGRQLRLVANEDIPEEASDNWLAEAVRVSLQGLPLLSHRTAVLMTRLIDNAFTADTNGAQSLFVGFTRAQVSRIMTNGTESQRLYAERDLADTLKLVESYKKLAEGLLRPFGALVVHLHAVANELATPTLSVRPLLGELSDSLLATGTELGRLLTLGLTREIRNAAAHEDLVLDTMGQVSILANDGTLTQIEPDRLNWDRAILEAALVGVDVANGAAVWRHLDKHASKEDMSWGAVIQTPEALEELATVVARDVADGFVTDLTAEQGEVKLTAHGDMSRLQAMSFLAVLDAFLHPDTMRVVVKDPSGATIVDYRRTPDESTATFPDD